LFIFPGIPLFDFAPKLACPDYGDFLRIIMPNIKPVSDLRNYTDILKDIKTGGTVFLTKNGRGRSGAAFP
jgi:hypothetical protein